MVELKKHSVLALTEGFVAPDYGHIEIHLAVASEQPLILAMTPNSLSQVVARLTAIELAVQIEIGTTIGHVPTQAADVSAVTAQEAVGGSKVIISMRTSTGRVQSFALSVEQVQQLRVDARKAEAKAREQASKIRN
jgi:hypothetical protein